MDLAQQYDQTLQNTIGQSQRERNRALRQAQEQGTSQLSNVPGSSTWSDRGTSGFRGAGFQEVFNPQVDTKTRAFLGNFLGDYIEGGKNQAGYYGTDNPYTEQGAYSLAKKGGYDYAPETLQSQFKAVGQSLPSIYGKSLVNQNIRDVGLKIGDWQIQQKAEQAAKKSQLFGNIDWNSFRGGNSPNYQKQKLDDWSTFVQAGFIPGQPAPKDWKFVSGTTGPARGALRDPNAGYWQKGDTTVGYSPKKGYSTSLDTTKNWKDDLASIMTVASVIGGVVLPGLGTSFGALAGDTLGSAGIPTSGLSTTSLGVSPGMATVLDPVLSRAATGGLNSLMGGGSFWKGALSGGLGAGAGGALNNITSGLGNTFSQMGLPAGVGTALGNFATGAGSNLASNLFNKNTGQGMLQSALSSGVGRSLGGLYNTTQGINDPKERMSNIGTATQLVKLFQQRKR